MTARTARERIAAGVTLALMLAPLALAVRAGAATEGIQVRLQYKTGWTASQVAEADAKVAALNQAVSAGEAVKTLPQRGGTSAASRYRAACGAVPMGCDIDHILDLQIGGEDVLANMNPLDSSVNRSLGAQIYHAIKNAPYGTKIVGFTIGP
jgi:filamentous hemagglutinin